MDTLIEKARLPNHDKPQQERIQQDKNFSTTSEPKRDMIMPKEFNSVSDPQIQNHSLDQTTITTFYEQIF